jgi:hypothetical protein
MRRLLRLLVPTLAASAVAFGLHRVLADLVPGWMAGRMEGVQVRQPPYGPEVAVPAMLTCVEYGAALLAAYALLRRATPRASVFVRALLLAVLCLALQGAVLRMPVMQLVIGNPLLVTLVQHAAIWVPHVAASLALAYTYEAVVDVGVKRSIELEPAGGQAFEEPAPPNPASPHGERCAGDVRGT